MADPKSTAKTDTIHEDLGKGPFANNFPASSALIKSPISVRIPRRLKIALRTTLFVFFIFSLAVIFVPWTQTVTVEGKLSAFLPEQRPQEVHSQIKGRIRKWHVKEGDAVKEGDLILELSDIDPKFMAPDLIERIDQSLEALANQRKAALEREKILAKRLEAMPALAEASISSAEARVSEAENKILNREQRTKPAEGALQTARLNLERSQALESQGLLSKRELELAIQKVTETEAKVNEAQAGIQEVKEAKRALAQKREKINAELVQKMLDTRAKRTSALSDAAKAGKQIADLKLKRSNAMERQKASRVFAPMDGTVVRVARVGAGETVKSGSLLFTVVPKQAQPAIEMWARSIDAPLLKPGRPVRILFQGVPAIPLPAWPELMAGTFDGRIQVVDQSASPNNKFRLWVVPDNKRKEWPPQSNVRQGTQVMGWVLLNRVPLWYEMWRRFNLFPPDYESGERSLRDVLIPKAGRSKK